jgi:hypothetical protein
VPIGEIGKLTDKHFIDWFNDTFPYCYGTGEQHIIPALVNFFVCLKLGNGKSYDYAVLERVLGPTVAWLMIGKLCGAYIFEYGTSPRYAWLTQRGEALNAYLEGKTDDQLVELVTETDQDYIFCYPDRCNCDQPCNNPCTGASSQMGSGM